MRFYILDDDINAIRMLSNLIEDYELGKVIKTSTQSELALKEIEGVGIDICIIDYLMPKLDGSTFIKKIKEKGLNIDFIMVSQVEDEAMISESYINGAELVIHKPINSIEFRKVVDLIIERRRMSEKFMHIKSFINQDQGVKNSQASNTHSKALASPYKQRMEHIFTELGISGEKGAQDILKVCEQMILENQFTEMEFNSLLNRLGERPQTVTQRMRRAISKGLNNIAHLGIDDYCHEIFDQYAYRLFEPQSVREEMAHIKKKSPFGGKVNLFQFISSLMILVKE